MKTAEAINESGTPVEAVDITPKGISEFIDKVTDTGLDIYDPESSERKRALSIGQRRPFITKLDERLRALKGMYPAETRNKKGYRSPDHGYQRASLRLREFRRQISSVQKADRLTLIGKM